MFLGHVWLTPLVKVCHSLNKCRCMIGVLAIVAGFSWVLLLIFFISRTSTRARVFRRQTLDVIAEHFRRINTF